MNAEPTRIGLVGAGSISGAYLESFTRLPGLKLTAVADLDARRAQAIAEKIPGIAVTDLNGLVDRDDVDIVLNLTIPAAHAEVALTAIEAGKHVYGEKPLTGRGCDAVPVLTAAGRAGLRVGCAPDTVLGVGTQTARKAVDDGLIGAPVAATAFMTTPGHEAWHPDPEFYYQPGGGPLLDMGPYYLTALVHLLGPVRRVVGLCARPRATRTIGSGPKAGQSFAVNVETHVTGVLEHVSGVLTTVIMSFDIWAARLPRIEVYGTEATLSVPDPNGFGGDVEIFSAATQTWKTLDISAGYADAGRGYGLADMARAIAAGQPHRATGEVAGHVLDVMESLLAAGETGSEMPVRSTCRLPALVPLGATPDEA